MRVQGNVTATSRLRWLALGAALGATGCVMPNPYTVPRATPVGRWNTVLTPQVLREPRGDAWPQVMLGMRAGLAKRVDVGMRTNLRSLAADFKWNALRSEHFDLAIDAGAEYRVSTVYLHFPLLMGINLSDSVTLLPNTGLSWGLGEQPDLDPDLNATTDPVNPPPPIPRAGGAFVRAGFGAQVRFTPRFAVQPEVLYLRLAKPSPGTHDFMAAGLAFIWGQQPY